MHGESGRVVGNLDLFHAEVEQRLNVCTRDGEDASPPELRRDRPVRVPSDDPPHLRVALDLRCERRRSAGGRPTSLHGITAVTGTAEVAAQCRRSSWLPGKTESGAWSGANS